MSTQQNTYYYGPKIPVGPVPGSNFGQFILEKMRENKEKIYLIDPETDEQWTYQQTADSTVRVALEMKSRGVKPGQIVAIIGLNRLEIILPVYASFLLGATVLPVHPILDEYEYETIFTFAKPDYIFCDLNIKKKLQSVLKKLQISASIVTFEEDFHQFMDDKNGSKVQDFRGVSVDVNDSIATIMCTSGTTGDTKGVPGTHSGYYSVLLSMIDLLPTTNETPIILLYSPISWMTAILFYLLTIMLSGKRIIANFTMEKHFEKVDKYKVNFLISNPNLITEIVKNQEFSKSYMKNSMRVLFFGGSASTQHQIDEYYDNFPNAIIRQGLGSTENMGFHLIFPSKEDTKLVEKNRYALGKITPNLIGKLIDPNTNKIIIEPNNPGELLIKSPSLFKGYVQKPELNQKVFDSEGFYRTGDILLRDKDGIFTFVGRTKDHFKYQHHKIDPLEIENVIVQHPAVNFACVMGKPDPLNVELPMAFVIKNSGFEKTSENEIISFVNDKVEEYQKLRGGIVFLDEFPLTTTGKLRKNELRKLIL